MTRERLKDWAKTALNRSYWKSVLVALILTATVGSSSSSGSGSGDLSEIDFSQMSEEEIIIILGVIAVVLFIGFMMWIVGMLIKAFLLNPLHVGCQAYFCEGLENPEVSLGLMGKGFKPNYKNVAKTMFFKDLYLFFWSLLSWIPVIIFLGGVLVCAIFEENLSVSGDDSLISVILIILGSLMVLGVILAMIPYIMKSYEYLLIPYILADNPDMERKEAFALTKKMMTGHKWEAFVLYLSFMGWYILSAFTCGILNIFYVEPYRAYTIAAYYKVLNQKNQALETPNYGEVWNG